MSKKVIYGNNVYEVEDNVTVEEVHKSMTDLFPELAAGKVEKDAEGNFLFSVQGGTKGKSLATLNVGQSYGCLTRIQ